MSEINVRFRDMSDEEYNQFVEESVLDYSKNLIKSGRSDNEKAFKEAKKAFDELLPQGKSTEDNFLYRIVNSENEDVGIIWYNTYEENIAFIADFLIFEQFRKKGYGKQALVLVDKDAKEKGCNKVMLHVFKFNTIAFSLYKSLGYRVVEEESTGFIMVKDM